MYSIVNTSGRYLSIQDLRIMLSPRERIDLDNVWKELDYFIKPVKVKGIFDF